MDTIIKDAWRRSSDGALSRPRAGLIRLLSVWHARSRTRAELRRRLADPHALADLGLSLDAADVEANKPFWR